MNIDFKKYKRIFAFGCSFTSYGWPTWADLIAYDNPDCQYFNHGSAGTGNIAITTKISQANQQYNFTEGDLVMVMWSTFSRYDFWVKNGWLNRGNIWNTDQTEDWLEKHADPLGFMVRDHSIINLTNKFLKSQSFDSLILRSCPFTSSEGLRVTEDEMYFPKLQNMYQEEYDSLPTSLYEFFGNQWESDRKNPPTIIEDTNTTDEAGTTRVDGHPRTTRYLEYLNSIGIQLSDETVKYATDSNNLMIKPVRRSTLDKEFNTYFLKRQGRHLKPLF